MAQRKRIRLGIMRLQVPSLASLNGLRIQRCCGCGVGHRLGSDLALLWLWLWCRQVATAPIGPLAWEPQYAMGAALEKKGKKTIIIIISIIPSTFTPPFLLPQRDVLFSS